MTDLGHDRKYLDWLREQPCAVSGTDWKPSDPAHVFKNKFGGGVARKSLKALPLSHEEHLKQSGMSELQYWKDVFNNDPALLIRAVGALCEQYERQYLEEIKK